MPPKRPVPPKRHAPSPEFEHVHELLHHLIHIGETIMANQAEIVATLQRASAKQEKTITEITTLQGHGHLACR